jgi:hypothetical protein
MKLHSLLAFVLSVCTAHATSFYIRPFSEFTKSTNNIVRGKISNIRADHRVSENGEKTIFTFADLDVRDIIKGNITGTQIQIRRLGGTKDGITLEIPSSVEFIDKEESVFFLSDEQEDHSYEVTSMELGKFTLVEKNGEEFLQGGIFAYSQPRPGHEHDVIANNTAENLKPWSINQLKELVKTQQQLPYTNPEEQKSPEVSISTNVANTIAENSGTPSEQPASISEEKENSALYFDSTVWYSLATIILTLSVFFYRRRR